MPIFLYALIGGLVTALGTVAGRLLISLGIGFVTYQGIDVLLGFIKDRIVSELSTLDVLPLQVLSTLQVDTAINTLFSAYAARLIIQGVSGGTFSRVKVKP